jgi:peroxiredoxin
MVSLTLQPMKPLIPMFSGLLVCVASHAWAASIQLEDQTALEADVLQVDDEDVIIRIPRTRIGTINGKPLPPALVEGAAAPPFQVTDIRGNAQALGTSQGRVTVLHFWVSWCPHCRSDAPQMQALYTQFRAHPKVAIVTVSLDEQREALDRFVADRQVTYPIIDAAEQAKAPGGVDLAQLYYVNGFPVTYLIDGKGIIKQKIRGSFVETGVDLGKQLEALLAS